jgi:hypothetical protein
MANKKISEITVKASGGDLSGARYIAAVPDGSGFVTKYVQGFGSGSAGGFIDRLTISSNDTGTGKGSYGTKTFPDYNHDTQILLVAGTMQEIPITSDVNSGGSTGSAKYVHLPDSSDPTRGSGSVRVWDFMSGNATASVHVARFTKANLGGGGGGGFIDQVTQPSGTLADFDSNTQAVMVQAISHSGSTLFTGAQVEVPADGVQKTILTVGSGRGQVLVKFTLNSNGSYTSQGVGYIFYITRFGKQ